MKPARRWTRYSRSGARSLFPLILLTACASTPPLSLPPTRIVIACPPNLVWKSPRQLPEIPNPLTNLGLKNYADALLDLFEAEWNEADKLAAECRDWLAKQK